jgi:hypothetical protein
VDLRFANQVVVNPETPAAGTAAAQGSKEVRR